MAQPLRIATNDSPPLRGPRGAGDGTLGVLLEVTRAIGAVLDPDELARRIMQCVTHSFGADRSTLFLHDEKRRELVSKVAQGLEPGGPELRIPDDQGLCGHVARTRRSLLVRDTFAEERFRRDFAERTGYAPRSMMVVPVGVAHRPGRCDGVLQVMHRRVGAFDADDLAMLEAVSVQVGVSLDNARLYAAQRRQFESFVRAFSAALDARDPSTQAHSAHVANYATGIAHFLGLDRAEAEWLHYAGLLHDVGKIGTPEAILTKPGRLDPAEFEEMKRHAAHTRRILSQIDFSEELAGMDTVASAHHEKLDGSGYPDGLRGDAIPLRARVLAVADIFDALTSDRHYRKGMEAADALASLDAMTPHQLDATCVEALRAFMGQPAAGE